MWHGNSFINQLAYFTSESETNIDLIINYSSDTNGFSDMNHTDILF
jgi:hypothetical protein